MSCTFLCVGLFSLGPPNLTASEAVNPTAPLEESHEPPARPVERGLKKSVQYEIMNISKNIQKLIPIAFVSYSIPIQSLMLIVQS